MPPVHLAPIGELIDRDEDEEIFAGFTAEEARATPLRQKRDKVAALDMRFQRYRKADP